MSNVGVPPLSSPIPLDADGDAAYFDQPWANWISGVFLSIFGWRKTYTGTLAKTWAQITAHTEASQTVAIPGARSGDAVLVQAATKTTGIIDNLGVVTADNTVTIYAQNTTDGDITPGAKTYRVIVFQQ